MKTKTPRVVVAFLFACIGLLCRSARAQVVTEFSAGISPGAAPTGITAGPCGDGGRCLWFTESGLDRIGRITLGGTVTEFSAGISAGAQLTWIAEGPDGNLWFTEVALSQIGRLNPATGAVTEFKVPDPNVFQVTGMTAGPDGNLWFATYGYLGRASVGRIDPTTGVITLFSAGITNGSQPFEITAGPDGNLWFTEYGQGIPDLPSKIGHIATDGTVTEFSAGIYFNAGPTSITAGADGKLWFTEVKVNRIANIDPITGNVTEFSDMINFSRGSGEITAGPDGNLWFTETATNRIGRIATDGTVTLLNGLTLVNPFGITAGPDGNLWFAEGGDRIGRITIGNNTPAGSNVQVDLGGGAGAAGGISVTFSQVTGTGNTVLTSSGSCPAVPSGFALGTPAVCDDVTTTAAYSPPVQVCINYSGISFGSGPIALLHDEGGTWVDVTTSVDSTNHVVCGNVNSLSPFVVAEKTGGGTSPTTTAIVSSLNPSQVGQPVTFTATVAGNSPGGTIQFMDGTANHGKKNLGSPLGLPVTLSGGVAEFTTSALTQGTHKISAVYSGDASNEPSTSPVLQQKVKRQKGHGKSLTESDE